MAGGPVFCATLYLVHNATQLYTQQERDLATLKATSKCQFQFINVFTLYNVFVLHFSKGNPNDSKVVATDKLKTVTTLIQNRPVSYTRQVV